MQGEFSYSTQPHAAHMRKTNKYRDENEHQSDVQNVMYDARVVRGNTYSAKILSNSMQKETSSPGKSIKLQSPTRKNKKYNEQRSRTPPAVDGRVHMDIQTESFLEELSDRPIEKNAETQTHLFYDRPASPLFIPTKTGRDVETQILPGDLFLFDMEVEPILEVLVGKTLQSAMLELMQEEELEAIRQSQYDYETIRDAELAEVKRLEAESLRKHKEKERRVAQAKKRQEEREQLNNKIAAKTFAIQLLGDVQLQVFDVLEREGYFYDPVQKEIDELYMPELIAGLKHRIECYNIAEQMATEVLENVLAKSKVIEAEEIKQRMEIEAKAAAARLVEETKQKEEVVRQQKVLQEEKAKSEAADGDDKEEEEE